jgi:Sigma-70, region 4
LRNLRLNQVRNGRSRYRVVEMDELDGGTREVEDKSSKDPLFLCLAKVKQADVRNAIEELPAVYREVIVLRGFEELSCHEIAQVLDCPCGTVMSRLQRPQRPDGAPHRHGQAAVVHEWLTVRFVTIAQFYKLGCAIVNIHAPFAKVGRASSSLCRRHPSQPVSPAVVRYRADALSTQISPAAENICVEGTMTDSVLDVKTRSILFR